MLIAVAADKGAPGVSTTALALALSWPRPVLLAECDAAGADLPWRLAGHDGRPLAQGLGLMSLATASRGVPAGARQVWDHVQHLDGGLPVLVGPPGPEQAAAMGGTWSGVAGLLAGVAGTDVIADCGRTLTTSSLVGPVLQHADVVVLVTRPTVAGVAHLRHGITTLAQVVNRGRVGESGLARVVVLVVDDPATPGSRKANGRQVDGVLKTTPGLHDVPVLGVIAHDPKAAAVLVGAAGADPRKLARSALLGSAAAAATALLQHVEQLAGTGQVRA